MASTKHQRPPNHRPTIRVRRCERSRFLPLALPFVLEHGRASLDFAQTIAVPDELGANPEFRLDAKRRLEQQRRLGGDPFLATQDAPHLGDRHAHALRQGSLAQATGFDELLSEDLARSFGRLRRGNADGENQAESTEEL